MSLPITTTIATREITADSDAQKEIPSFRNCYLYFANQGIIARDCCWTSDIECNVLRGILMDRESGKNRAIEM